MTERPVECSHCKRPVKVNYKEIVDDSIIETVMCIECPILQQKLHRYVHPSGTIKDFSERETGLCCGNCGTSLESLQTGNPLGCIECYAVFEDALIAQLLSSNMISPRLNPETLTKKSRSLHMGTSPHKPITMAPSSHILALNEALNEALKRENYEQAAWLRDQIKALEKPHDGKN